MAKYSQKYFISGTKEEGSKIVKKYLTAAVMAALYAGGSMCLPSVALALDSVYTYNPSSSTTYTIDLKSTTLTRGGDASKRMFNVNGYSDVTLKNTSTSAKTFNETFTSPGSSDYGMFAFIGAHAIFRVDGGSKGITISGQNGGESVICLTSNSGSGDLYAQYYQSGTVTFSNNVTDDDSAAVIGVHNAKALVVIDGNATFSGNKVNDKPRDIYNKGTVKLIGNVTMDGGINGSSGILEIGDNDTTKTNTVTLTGAASIYGQKKITVYSDGILDMSGTTSTSSNLKATTIVNAGIIKMGEGYLMTDSTSAVIDNDGSIYVKKDSIRTNINSVSDKTGNVYFNGGTHVYTSADSWNRVLGADTVGMGTNAVKSTATVTANASKFAFNRLQQYGGTFNYTVDSDVTLGKDLSGTSGSNGAGMYISSGGTASVTVNSGKTLTFKDGKSASYGGGIYITSSSNLTLGGGTIKFENNQATGSGSGGGAIAVMDTGSSLMLDVGTYLFSGNHSGWVNGGAINNASSSAQAGGTITIKGDATFTGNTAGSSNTPNDIYNNGTINLYGNVSMDGGITSNTVYESTLNIGDGDTAKKNTVTLVGGAGINQKIVNVKEDGTLSMGSGTLKTTNGIVNDGTLIMNGTDLQSNITTSGEYGKSTVRIDGGTMNLSEKTIKTARVLTYNAGTKVTFDLKNLDIGRDTWKQEPAFYLDTGSEVTIKNTGAAKTYDGMRVVTDGNYGGFAFVRDATLNLDGGTNGITISGNSGMKYGAGISLTKNSGTSNYTQTGKVTFKNNAVTELGGALMNFGGGTMTIDGEAIFEGNTAKGNPNDIHNQATLNLIGKVDMDGGISGSNGIMNIGDGDTTKMNTVTLTSAAGINGHTTITVNADGTLDMSASSGSITSVATLTNSGIIKMGSGELKTTNAVDNDGDIYFNGTTIKANINSTSDKTGDVYFMSGTYSYPSTSTYVLGADTLCFGTGTGTGLSTAEVTANASKFAFKRLLQYGGEMNYTVDSDTTFSNDLTTTLTGHSGAGSYVNAGKLNITVGSGKTLTYSGNKTGSACLTGGGGLSIRVDSTVTMGGGTINFTNNVAQGPSSKGGGAILSDGTGNTVTLNAGTYTFSGNKAMKNGGAVYNAGTFTINGSVTFTGNKSGVAADGTGGTANDVYNTGTMNLNGAISMDGGITGSGGTLNIGNGDSTKNTVTLTSAAGIAGQTTIAVKADGTLDMSGSTGNLSGATTFTNDGTIKTGTGTYSSNLTNNATGVVEIAKTGSFTGNIANAGKVNVTADAGVATLQSVITNTSTGEVNILGTGTLNSAVKISGGALNIGSATVSGKTLTANAAQIAALTTTIFNGDKLVLKDGVLGGKVVSNGTSGTGILQISGDVEADATYIAANTNTVDSGKKLTLVGSNAGKDLSKDISDAGEVVIKAGTSASAQNVVNANAYINTSKLTISQYSVLNIDVDRLGGGFGDAGLVNNGTIGFTANGTDEDSGTYASSTDTLQATLTGTGNYLFNAGSGKTIHANADKLKGTGANKVGTGTLDLIGGTLTVALQKGDTAGDIKITGTVETQANISDLNITVNSGKKLTVSNGTISGGTITNEGTFDITGGAIKDAVSNKGTMNVSGTSGVAALQSVITNTNAGIVNILETGTLNSAAKISGGALNIGSTTVTGKTLTAGAAQIAATTTMVFTGDTLKLNDGTLGGKVTGAGTLQISGNVEAKATYIDAATNTVDSGKILTLTGTNAATDKFTKDITGFGQVTIKASNKVTAEAMINTAKLLIDTGAELYLDVDRLGDGLGTAGLTNKGTIGIIANGSDEDSTAHASSTDTLQITLTGTGTYLFNAGSGKTIHANADKLKGTGANKVGTGTLDLTGGTLTVALQKGDTAGDIKITSTVETKANISDLNITVDATAGDLKVTNGTINGTVTNNKTLTLEQATGKTAVISGAVTNATAGTYTITAGTQSGAVNNSGILLINGGLESGALTNNSGGKVRVADSSYLGNGTKTVTNNNLMVLKTGTLSRAITNNKDLYIDGGTLGAAISGTGTVYIGMEHDKISASGTETVTADVTSNAKITAGAIKIGADDKLTIGAGNVGGTVYNDGTITLTGTGALAQNIYGTTAAAVDGTTVIDGTITSNNLINNEITVNGARKLTIAAGNIGGAVTGTNAVTGATPVAASQVILKTGTLSKTITNGEVIIDSGNSVTLGADDVTKNADVTVKGTLVVNGKTNLAKNFTLDNGGTLELRDTANKTYAITGDFTGNSGTINFDMIAASPFVETDHDIISVTGTVKGNVKLGSINLTADIPVYVSGDTIPAGKSEGDMKFDKITLFNGGTIDGAFTINETVTKYGNSAYRFYQDGHTGDLLIEKTASGLGLREIINGVSMSGVTQDSTTGTDAQKDSAKQAAKFNTYSFEVDTTFIKPYATYSTAGASTPDAVKDVLKNILKDANPVWDWDGTTALTNDQKAVLEAYDTAIENNGLGTLTRALGMSKRVLTLNGNGYKLNGGGFKGVTVNTGDTLRIVNVSEVSNFATDGVAINSGILELADSPNTTLSANVSGTGTAKITNSTITLTDGNTIKQGTMDVDVASKINAQGSGLEIGTINNSGTINIHGGAAGSEDELKSSISGNTGKVNIVTDAYVEVATGKTLAGLVDVAAGGNLTVNASQIAGGSIDNHGVLNLGDGTLRYTVKDSAATMTGKTVITGAVTNNSTITQQDLTINADKSLTTPAGSITITNAIVNEGTLTLTGTSAIFNNAVKNDSTQANGKTVIDGTITAQKLLDQRIEIKDSTDSLTLDVDLLGIGDADKNKVVNAGTVVLTADTTANGKTNVDTLEKVIEGGKITVAGDITSDVDNLKGEVTNATNTLTLTGGTDATHLDKLTVNIKGAGNVNIGTSSDAAFVEVESGKVVENKMTVSHADSVFKIEANSIKNTIANAGTLQMGVGEITNNITGTGKMIVLADNAVTLNNANTITQYNLEVEAGGSLVANVNNLIIKDGTPAYTAIANAGTITLNGTGDLNNALTGDGKFYVDGDITAKANIANDTYINAGKKLTTDAAYLQDVVADNAGTLTITADGTDDVIGKNINGTGEMVIDATGKTVTTGNVTIKEGKLTVAAGEFKVNPNVLDITGGKVTNNDKLTLIGGTSVSDYATLQEGIEGTGTTTVAEGAFVKIDGVIKQQVTVDKGTLNVDPDNMQAEITLVSDTTSSPTKIGTVIVDNGGTFNQVIGGTGKVEINADVTMGATGGFKPVVYSYFGYTGTPFTNLSDAETAVATARTAKEPEVATALSNMTDAQTAMETAKAALDADPENATKQAAYATAAADFKTKALAYQAKAKELAMLQVVPISGISVDLNAKFNLGDGNNINSGALKDFHIGSNGHLDLVNDKAGMLVVAGNFSADNGSRISLDVLNDVSMDMFSVLGDADGTLTIGTLNIKSELIATEKLLNGEPEAVAWVDIPIFGEDTLAITGTTTAYGDYIYTITYEVNPDTSGDKQLKIVKEWGFSLPDIIQAKKNGAYSEAAAKIATYSFTEDAINMNHAAVKGGDLGTLTRKTDAGTRELTLNGNQHSLNGGGYAGITVNAGDKLAVTDITSVENFKDNVLVTNNGTLTTNGTVTTKLNSSVKGTGKLEIGNKVELGTFSYTTTKVTDFKGQTFRKDVDGDYVDSQNNKLTTQTEEFAKLHGVMDSCELDADGKPVPGWYVGTTFYALKDAVMAAVAAGGTSYTVPGTSIKVTLGKPVIQQKDLTIEKTGALTGNANQLQITNAIKADGDLNFTGGVLANDISGIGTVTIDDLDGDSTTIGEVALNGNVLNNMVVKANNILTITAEHVGDAGTGNTITNEGEVKLGAGTLENKITDGATAGKITLTGNVTTLADNLDSATESKATTLTLIGGTIGKDITGEAGGKLKVTTAMVTNNAAVTIANVEIASGAGLTTDFDKLTILSGGSVSNAGTFNLNGSTTSDLEYNITGSTGTTNIGESVKLTNKGQITQGTVNITTATAALTTPADKITVETLNNAGTLTLTGENKTFNTVVNGYTVGGSTTLGKTIIDGTITDTKALNNLIEINAGKKLIIDAVNVGGDVTNKGTLELTGGAEATPQTLAYQVSGTDGDLVITGYVNNKDGNAVQAKNVNITGTLEIGADELTVTNAINNTGTLSLTGEGSLDKNINGDTGKTYINGNVTLTGLVGNEITVTAGHTLNTKPDSIGNKLILASEGTNIANVVVPAGMGGTFTKMISGAGKVTVNGDVTMGEGSGFEPTHYINPLNGTVSETYVDGYIPMSSLDVDLNAKLNITSTSLTGGGLQNLTIGSDGHLDFANGSVGTMVVNTFHGDGGSLSLDVLDDNQMDKFVVLGQADGTIKLGTVNVQSVLLEDKVVNGKVAGGDVKKYFGYDPGTGDANIIFMDKDGHKINVTYNSTTNEITGDAEELAKLVVNDGSNQVAAWVDLPIGIDNLTIEGTTSVFGANLYEFTYEQNSDAGNDKQIKIVKTMGFSLHEIIQGYVSDAGFDTGTVTTYSFSGNIANVALMSEDGTSWNPAIIGWTADAATSVIKSDDLSLGTLTRAGVGYNQLGTTGGSGNRTFTLNGNGAKLNGAGWGGITVQEGDTLNLNNIAEVANFKEGIVATNDGTVKVSGGNMTVIAGVKDSADDGSKGTLVIDGAVVKIELYEKHFNTGAFAVDKSTGKFYSDVAHTTEITDSNLTPNAAVVIKQKEIQITNGGELKACATNLQVGTIVNDSVLTLTHANPSSMLYEESTLNAVVSGSGKLIVDTYYVTATKQIDNAITINADKKLVIEAANIGGAVTNNGNIVITTSSGTLEQELTQTITGGKVQIGGATSVDNEVISMTANKLVNSTEIKVNTGDTLKFTGDNNIDYSVDIIGDGKVEIVGTITALSKIAATGGITVAATGILTADGSKIGANVTNGNIVNVTGDTLANVVTGGVLNITGDVSADADNIKGNTNNVAATKTLTLTSDSENSDTLTGALTGAGKTVIDGTVISNASIATAGGLKVNSEKSLQIAADNIGVDVVNDGTLKVNDGDLAKKVTGDGTLNIIGTVTNTAGNKIAQNTLDISSSTGDFTAALSDLTVDTITNAGTFTTHGTLAQNIGGTGTTKLDGELKVGSAVNVEGTLDGNNNTLNMQNDTTTTFNVETLTGTTNMKIDVDLSDNSSDLLSITTGSGATVNLTGINITKDVGIVGTLEVPKEYTNAITYVNGAGANSATYTLADDQKNKDSKVATNRYVYEFALGDAGQLTYTVKATDVTLKSFLERTIFTDDSDPNTLSLTGDLITEAAGTATVANDSDGKSIINLNDHTLNAVSPYFTVTVGESKNLTINGGSVGTGTVGENIIFAMNDNSTLELGGKIELDSAISGTGKVDVKGDVTANANIVADKVDVGAGNTLTMGADKELKAENGITNAGAITVDAAQLKGTVANSTGANVTLNAGTLTEGSTITGGAITINGDVSANVNDLKSNEGIANEGSTLTLTGEGTLADDITGAGTTNIGGTVTSAKNIANTVTVDTGANFTNTGTISGAVTNEGTMTTTANGITGGMTNNSNLDLTGGNLASDITGTGTTTVSGTVTNTNNKGITQNGLTIVDTGNLTTEVDTLNINSNAGPITNNGTLTLTADGTSDDKLAETVEGTGTLNFGGSEKITAAGAITQGTVNVKTDVDMDGVLTATTTTVDSDKTLEIDAGNLLSDVTNNGTVALGTGTLADGSTITGGAITIAGDVTANANDLKSSAGITNESSTLTLTAGSLADNITGSGNTEITGAVTSAGNIENAVTVDTGANFNNSGNLTGTSIINNGTMTNSGTVSGPLTNAGTFTNTGTLSGAVDNSGNMTTTFAGIKDIASSGGAGVTNTGSLTVTGGGALSGQTIGGAGNITLQGNYTANWTDLESTSALVINNGTLDASSSTLTLVGLTKDNKDATTVKLVDLQGGATATGWAGLGDGTYTDKDNTGIYAPGLKKFTIASGVLTVVVFGSNFVPMDETDGIRTSGHTVANAMAESTDNNITKFIDGISDLESSGGSKAASDAINAAMNVGEAGGVQHGLVSMVGFVGEAIGTNMSIIYRPIMANPQAIIQKTAADDKKAKNAKIEEVPVAKASELMPVAYKAPKYEKTVWASYMHNKETINGLQLDGVEQNGTAQYNGTTVGLDMWSSGKVIGGVALAYTDGKVNSNIGSASTKNEVDYYGVSIYNRWTNGKNGILADIGYMYAKNELTQRVAGSEITGDAKIHSITAGVRVEQLIKMGKSNLVPFAGVRFMHNKNNEYTMDINGSSGTHYAPDDQNIISPQLGLAWNGEFEVPGSKWTFRPSVEGGYVWNLGDRDTESVVSFGGASNTIGYDVADKSSYYAQLGMEFRKDNVILGVTYKYQKGDAVTNKKWNFNVTFTF